MAQRSLSCTSHRPVVSVAPPQPSQQDHRHHEYFRRTRVPALMLRLFQKWYSEVDDNDLQVTVAVSANQPSKNVLITS